MKIYEKEGFAYSALYSEMREKIVRGAFKRGDKLPPKRVVAEEKGVSVITVEHAYGLLCEEGYAEGRERKGYYVTYSEEDWFSTGGEKIIIGGHTGGGKDLSAFSLPLATYKKTARVVLNKYGGALLTRSEKRGTKELLCAVKRYLNRKYGINVSENQIIVGAGSEYLYGVLALTLKDRGVFAVESPSYHKIEKTYSAHGVACDPLSLGEDGVKSEELKRTTAKVLHVTPYGSFPTGITASPGKKREYLAWVQSDGRTLIEDDFESEFALGVKNAETIFSLDKSGKTVYLNSFTKTLSPAIRAAYMVLPQALLKEYEDKAGFFACTVPKFEQYLIAELLDSGDFEKHVNRVRNKLRREKITRV